MGTELHFASGHSSGSDFQCFCDAVGLKGRVTPAEDRLVLFEQSSTTKEKGPPGEGLTPFQI